MRETEILSIILGGGKGERLYPLTKYRAKPAVPLAGKYRLIDIAMSNCINSGFRQIYVLTQFNSESLNRHILQSYNFDTFSKGFVHVLAAEQTRGSTDWFLGTADAVRKNLQHFNYSKISDMFILSGDHLYRMDLMDMLKVHREKNADITVAVKPVHKEDISRFGIVGIDENGKIIDFKEKPKAQELKNLAIEKKHLFWGEDKYLGSMGIYLFKKESMLQLLQNPDNKDFGSDMIPYAIQHWQVYTYVFNGFWEDIGTIKSFYEANINLTKNAPDFNFYDENNLIYTHPRFLPASRIGDCVIKNCIISDGCNVINAKIKNSIIGIRSIINEGNDIRDSIIMGADYFETEEQKQKNVQREQPNIGIGKNCEISGAIIDKNARIGDRVIIINKDRLQNYEGDNYVIKDGIVVIEKNAVIKSGTII